MSAALALALFDLLLFVSPREFRRAYRVPMRRDFGEAFREEFALHGAFGSLGYALGAYADLIATGLHERLAMILRDLVYAVRSMTRAPLLAGVIIATLALAIAANAAVFSVLGGVLLKPLPYPDPQRLVAVWEFPAGRKPSAYSYPNFLDLRAQNTSFTEVAAAINESGTLTGRGRPRAMKGFAVSAGYFDVIGVKPQSGHFFTASDERAGSAAAIVLSYPTFTRVFNGDPQVMGATAVVDGTPYTIVGVTPPGFQAPDPNQGFITPDYWTVLRATPANGFGRRGMRFLSIIARLRPGASIASANADVSTIVSRLSVKYVRDVGKHETGSVTALDETILGPVRPLLYGVFAAVGALLLVACANVANLLLSRAARRERELAVRYAVGASRGRIVSQILTETLVYAAIGGIVGIFLAIVAVREFIELRPRGIPRLDTVTFDVTAALYT